MKLALTSCKLATITESRLNDKHAIINAQLKEVGIPLRYQLFFGADKQHFNQIPLVAKDVVGIKVFMGCSTGDLVIDDDESLHAVFDIAAKNNLIVAVHAEDEDLLKQSKHNYKGPMAYAAHSVIRNIEVARYAVEKAINLTRKYGTRLYILHVSSMAEIALIKAAKAEGLPVFAETTPHHLFLDESAYANLQGRAVVNPPLRLQENHLAHKYFSELSWLYYAVQCYERSQDNNFSPFLRRMLKVRRCIFHSENLPRIFQPPVYILPSNLH